MRPLRVSLGVMAVADLLGQVLGQVADAPGRILRAREHALGVEALAEPGHVVRLVAKLPEILAQQFPEDDDRRFAQLGPDAIDGRDILDNMEEVADEVVINVVGLPVLEEDTDTPTG